MLDKEVVVEETEIIEEIETTTADPAFQLDPGVVPLAHQSFPACWNTGCLQASVVDMSSPCVSKVCFIQSCQRFRDETPAYSHVYCFL